MSAMSSNSTPSWPQLRELFHEMLSQLFEEAKVAREYAVSYRDFRVGCAGLAYNTETGKWEIFRGANLKVSRNGRPVCAESIVVQAARARGYNLIIGLGIVAETQRDDDSGVVLDTLTPCAECRETLLAIPAMSLRSLIATATPDLSTQEVRSFGEVLKIHGSDGRSYPQTADSPMLAGDLDRLRAIARVRLVNLLEVANDLLGVLLRDSETATKEKIEQCRRNAEKEIAIARGLGIGNDPVVEKLIRRLHLVKP
ncbi:MAG: hypothetical protein Greene071421_217 [Parcubacteria group bacterium Greene0714_21]|nr:MAG: hypothetical protein Greene041639_318 [Parcubacteria group bacterium Greene0416_39]TSC97695.1 MAG: hypothetical protein Greene101447_332 [Parcubacteria group bacterium Greene1014_47]TSD04381.1 MAG: hypothetical protein Greene071421_217 [Parcubacteria group bacterium Greene0714_21]